MLFSVVLFVFNACSNPYLAGTLVFKINYKSPGYFPGGGMFNPCINSNKCIRIL